MTDQERDDEEQMEYLEAYRIRQIEKALEQEARKRERRERQRRMITKLLEHFK